MLAVTVCAKEIIGAWNVVYDEETKCVNPSAYTFTCVMNLAGCRQDSTHCFEIFYLMLVGEALSINVIQAVSHQGIVCSGQICSLDRFVEVFKAASRRYKLVSRRERRPWQQAEYRFTQQIFHNVGKPIRQTLKTSKHNANDWNEEISSEKCVLPKFATG